MLVLVVAAAGQNFKYEVPLLATMQRNYQFSCIAKEIGQK
jgi:hypothetical protein